MLCHGQAKVHPEQQGWLCDTALALEPRVTQGRLVCCEAHLCPSPLSTVQNPSYLGLCCLLVRKFILLCVQITVILKIKIT